MGRIKDLNSALPSETDNLVFDGLNGTRRISYADFKQKLQDDGFGSGSSEAVVLTQAEYDALPDEVKDSDTIFFISDAPFENSNVVTLTRAQYDALSDATKMDGRFYYITDEEEVAKSLVVQTNVNSTETVPSSAVVYGLNEALNDSFTNYKQITSTNVKAEIQSHVTTTRLDDAVVTRCGNIVNLVISNMSCSTAQNNTPILYNLPRPAVQQVVSCPIYGDQTNCYRLGVSATGVVTIACGTGLFYAVVTYIAAS